MVSCNENYSLFCDPMEGPCGSGGEEDGDAVAGSGDEPAPDLGG
jgi:hypothetical protein